eukprot:4297658-Prymnesium_polylepis.1
MPQASGRTRCEPPTTAVRMRCDVGPSLSFWAFAQKLPANEGSCEDEYEEDGPRGSEQHTLAVLAQARARDKNVLQLGRQLEEVDPSRILLQPLRRHHVEDARHC